MDVEPMDNVDPPLLLSCPSSGGLKEAHTVWRGWRGAGLVPAVLGQCYASSILEALVPMRGVPVGAPTLVLMT